MMQKEPCLPAGREKDQEPNMPACRTGRLPRSCQHAPAFGSSLRARIIQFEP